jgi:hypothetical protein
MIVVRIHPLGKLTEWYDERLNRSGTMQSRRRTRSAQSMIPRRRSIPLSFLPLVAILVTSTANAGSNADSETRERFCARPFTMESFFRSEASEDLYNAALWVGGTAAIQFGTTPESRWTRENGFDDGIRDGLRGGSESTRDSADVASDVMLGVSAGLIPLLSIGKTLYGRDCHAAFDMATDAAEAIGLTLLLTSSAKALGGRERPYVNECDGSPPGDASCSDPDRKQSFFSGHASMAATGAGLSCSYAIKRQTWGEGRVARFTPCALGIGAAITTGALRIVADKHWGSDVLVGLVVGAAVGYFDTWGPFDLLRFEAESQSLGWNVRGIALPYAVDGEFGVRMALTF